MTVRVTRRVDGTGSTRTADNFTIHSDSEGVYIESCLLGCVDDYEEFSAHMAAAIEDMKRCMKGDARWNPSRAKKPKRGTVVNWPVLENKA